MGEQQERVTIDGKEYVLAGPNANAKYAGLYSCNGLWYRIENGEATFVPMSGWQRRSAGGKAVIIFGAIVGGLVLLWLISIGTEDSFSSSTSSSSTSSSGGNSDVAQITLTATCENECDGTVSNETGGKDAVEFGSLVQKFEVSNEDYEIYSIIVRDTEGGEAKCTAALTVDTEILERDTEISNGTSASCSVSTLVN